MAKKKKNAGDFGIENVENALSKTEQYIEENQKSLTIIVLAILVIVGGYFGYKRLYVRPLEKEAQEQMYMAEKYFEVDSFRMALYGDGQYPGFLEIIDDYWVTPSANLSNFYAGISYLHLGEYEVAIEHLKKFDSRDLIIRCIALGAIGDAYVELGELNEAVNFYVKAANRSKNNFSTPIYLMKAGLVFEELGDFKSALGMYETIKSDYPDTAEGRQVEKYIARARLLSDR